MTTCQFTATVGYWRDLKQCRLPADHTGPHVSGLTVLSPLNEIKEAR